MIWSVRTKNSFTNFFLFVFSLLWFFCFVSSLPFQNQTKKIELFNEEYDKSIISKTVLSPDNTQIVCFSELSSNIITCIKFNLQGEEIDSISRRVSSKLEVTNFDIFFVEEEFLYISISFTDSCIISLYRLIYSSLDIDKKFFKRIGSNSKNTCYNNHQIQNHYISTSPHGYAILYDTISADIDDGNVFLQCFDNDNKKVGSLQKINEVDDIYNANGIAHTTDDGYVILYGVYDDENKFYETYIKKFDEFCNYNVENGKETLLKNEKFSNIKITQTRNNNVYIIVHHLPFALNTPKALQVNIIDNNNNNKVTFNVDYEGIYAGGDYNIYVSNDEFVLYMTMLYDDKVIIDMKQYDFNGNIVSNREYVYMINDNGYDIKNCMTNILYYDEYYSDILMNLQFIMYDNTGLSYFYDNINVYNTVDHDAVESKLESCKSAVDIITKENQTCTFKYDACIEELEDLEEEYTISQGVCDELNGKYDKLAAECELLISEKDCNNEINKVKSSLNQKINSLTNQNKDLANKNVDLANQLKDFKLIDDGGKCCAENYCMYCKNKDCFGCYDGYCTAKELDCYYTDRKLFSRLLKIKAKHSQRYIQLNSGTLKQMGFSPVSKFFLQLVNQEPVRFKIIVNSYNCLEVKSNGDLGIRTNCGYSTISPSLTWQIHRYKDGSYILRNLKTLEVLGVWKNLKLSGVNMYIGEYQGKQYQRFILEKF